MPKKSLVGTVFFVTASLLSAAVFAQPAQAAPLTNVTVTSSAVIGTAGTNATDITVAVTAVTGSPSNIFKIQLPTGWTFVSPGGGQTCPSGITVVGISSLGGCQAINGGSTGFAPIQSLPDFTAGQSISVVFAAGSLNVASTRIFNVALSNSNSQPVGGADVDTGSATLAGGVANSTVTFNANGGTGAMQDQAASTSTALSTNALTRVGFTFNGWNTAADGSGTAYANGATYPFSSSITLYAQWSPLLATTGSVTPGIYSAALVFLIAGTTLMLASSRRRELRRF